MRRALRGCSVKCSATAEPPDRGDSGDDEAFSIDDLARKLSAEAGRLRVESGSDLSSDEDYDDFDSGSDSGALSREAQQSQEAQQASAAGALGASVPDFGVGSAAREAGVFAEVGPGGLLASDFQLIQQLARLSVQQVTPDASAANPLMASAAQETAFAAIVIFAGQYYSGMPYEDPAPVFLKEYLPGARTVAVNELATVHFLMGGALPTQKWAAATAPTTQLPVVPLLGYFEAGLSKAGASQLTDARAGEEPTLWLAFKWEGLQPLSMYPAEQQQAPAFFWFARGGAPNRLKMLRAIAGGCVAALAYVHERGVAHCSLGAGSLLLSTFSDGKSEQLVVKLDNFGFSQRLALPSDSREAPWPAQLPEDHPLLTAQREDLRALAVTLLETVFSALAVEATEVCTVPEEIIGRTGGGGQDFDLEAICRDTSAEAFQRLLFDVFGSDVRAFRRYAAQEAGWEAPVALLDEDRRAGWLLLDALISGSNRAVELLVSPFLEGT